MDTTQALLEVSLDAAVPLWIETFKTQPWADLQAKLPEIGDLIAHHGDNILFKSSKKGESAKAFNALAKALAIMAFVPGGVRFLNRTWDAEHPDLKGTV